MYQFQSMALYFKGFIRLKKIGNIEMNSCVYVTLGQFVLIFKDAYNCKITIPLSIYTEAFSSKTFG